MTDTMTRPDHTAPSSAQTPWFDRPPSEPPRSGPPPVEPPAGPPHRHGGGWPRRVAGGAAVLALIAGGGAAGGAVADHYLDRSRTTATTTAPVATTTVTDGDDLAAVAAKVSPSIVTLMVDGAGESSLGSGVVLRADGLVLTNDHVVASGGTVSVRLADGRTVPATVVATDAAHDLALVQATGVSGLSPATFGGDVAVGDTVLAFGAPLGLEGTVTAGIVSAVDRTVETGGESLSGLLQTDAPINSGNSGGALVDTSGDVIGINVAIATAGDGSTGSVGVGFAIPSGTVTEVVRRLEARTD